MDTFDERVRQRAYRLWVEEGCPEGRAEAHWDKARQLVAHEDKLTSKPAAAEQTGRTEPAKPFQAAPKATASPTLADPAKPTAAPKRAAAANASAKVKTSGQPKPTKEPGAKKR